RNAALLQRGLAAVRDVSDDLGVEIESMLHIAQPENARWWIEEAAQYGLQNFDWIGLSYYPKWSEYSLDSLSQAIDYLGNTYDKKVMVVETAYPFTLESQDDANNLLGADALISGFPATESGQLAYLEKLAASIVAGGGQGMVYWEPAWISTSCSTRWGQGSHWENASLFREDGIPTLGMQYYEWD
ncbi:MAG: glycosyl hydrolase 53 family protein, partial [Bacteroidota bacterium]